MPSILGDLFEFPTHPHGNGLEFFSDHKDLAETIVGAELKTLDSLMYLEEGGMHSDTANGWDKRRIFVGYGDKIKLGFQISTV